MTEQSNFLEQEKKIYEYLDKGNVFDYINIMKIIKEVIPLCKDTQEMGDFIGRVFFYNPDFFTETIFPYYIRYINKQLSYSEIVQLEEYIIKKYSLYPNEDILSRTPATVIIGRLIYIGRIYSTSFRMIVVGILNTKSPPVGGIIGTVLLIKNIKNRKNLPGRLENVINLNEGKDKISFGVSIPFFKLLSIRSYQSSLEYKILFEYNAKDDKIKREEQKVVIKPKKIMGEKKNEQINRITDVLSIIFESIKKINEPIE